MLLFGLAALSFKPADAQTASQKPKLVVGIVVDQMRFDYLTRFEAQFGDRGFKRLMSDGFECRNNHFNYVPTYTGPGHASIYTGTTPANHGIISNNWYNKFEKQQVYCAGDTTVASVGVDGPAGQMSPHRMLTTTITDQNRLHTQMRGKTIGVSLKDRGAILPAGHTANAAYWFEGGDEGKWITSTFYMDQLPKWVQEFNASAKAKNYLKEWNTLKPIETYVESGADLNTYEGGFRGKEDAVFPYDLEKLAPENGGYTLLKSTPYGNNLTTDFALEALDAEALGQDSDTDFLVVSYSATDYVGHNFGVNSKEVEDMYVRLDLDLERLLDALDKKVGEGNYTVFLTADHGAVNVPAYLSANRIPSGYFDNRAFATALNEFIVSEYGKEDLIEDISNYQVFFNYENLQEAGVNPEELQKKIAHFALQYDLMDKVYTRAELNQANYTSGVAALIQKGFNQKRSGDVFLVLDPGVISYSRTGSTHGSAFSYDTHAPLLFYGAGIKKGKTYKLTEIPDIAPTIAALLGIEFPNGTTGTIITEVLE
ncbi:MAG: alkaline phosphatase [Leeuwenhoekiella sp.]|nr:MULTISPECIES: alkaline phosphatase PafA [unclassified Leeuwenhoekiella]MAS21263.1 alkaline phosphatase [Leeuwenhoekiella sp.]MAW93903.1 alkaline phosphatase [Leeuwenhoekiella sp.]MBA81683.1 alkaline phosphatase [Leeuwenhoekiella sp.]